MDRLVYTAFADSYGEETDRLMLRYFTQARRESSFVPELSLVALTDSGEIMGQATLYETDIETPAGKNTQLVLSQSAVLPEYRGQGVMGALVTRAMDRARELGRGVFGWRPQAVRPVWICALLPVSHPPCKKCRSPGLCRRLPGVCCGRARWTGCRAPLPMMPGNKRMEFQKEEQRAAAPPFGIVNFYGFCPSGSPTPCEKQKNGL